MTLSTYVVIKCFTPYAPVVLLRPRHHHAVPATVGGLTRLLPSGCTTRQCHKKKKIADVEYGFNSSLWPSRKTTKKSCKTSPMPSFISIYYYGANRFGMKYLLSHTGHAKLAWQGSSLCYALCQGQVAFHVAQGKNDSNNSGNDFATFKKHCLSCDDDAAKQRS